MEAHWFADRTALRCLARRHPDWTQAQLASCIGRSLSFVKKWLKRFEHAPPDDLAVLSSRSRARHHPPPPPDPRIIERIIAIRTSPPENLQRTPGPRAILYYLQRDAVVREQGLVPPRSTRTVWKLLRQLGYILEPEERTHKHWLPRAPLEEVQMDFKDASTVPADPEGKKQHVVEVLNFVDVGTSILLSAQAHENFHAQTALEAVVAFLREYGLPSILTFDRDPRWVGSASGRDFPSALRRFLLCLGIEPNICPPHRPDLDAFVERYHRSYNQECLQIHRPSTLEAVREVTERFMHHYNYERPHQGRSCHNQPPRVAFPNLPKLAPLPESVDPDRWLLSLDGQGFARRVGADGCVEVDLEPYYIQRGLAGQSVLLLLAASEKVFVVQHAGQVLKLLPIKGLFGGELPFERYVTLMVQQAQSEARRLSRKRSLNQMFLWA